MKTHEQYIEELSEKNPTIECLDEYRGATSKILHQCKVCGHEWNVRPTSLVRNQPAGCPHCAAVKSGRANGYYTTESFQQKLAQVHQEIELIGEYPGSHKKASFHCLRCDNTWAAAPYSVLQGHGCPRCVKTGTSFMEQVFLEALRTALPNTEVLSRDKEHIGEELDIVIPSRYAAIEPGSWALHKSRFWKDVEKKSLCDEAGIRLIFIYDKFPSSEEIPFQEDCLTYTGDFNKDDHQTIWSFVSRLFEMLGIKDDFTEAEKHSIELTAYTASKSLTHEVFVDRMRQLNSSIEILGTYVNSNRRLKCRCKRCGRIWDAIPAALLSGDGCWNCARKEIGEAERLPVEQFFEILNQTNPDISIDVNTYKGTHARVKATCLLCGRTWMPLARTLIRKNPCGCSDCRKEERRISQKSRYLESLAKDKPHIECMQEYVNRETKIAHRCKVCGMEWETTPATVLASKYGCPNWRNHKQERNE